MERISGMAGLGSPHTLDRIRRVFVESLHLNLHPEDLSYEDKLDEVTGMDSVAVLEFVAALEKEFSITLEPEMLTIDVIRDLKQLAAYVEMRSARRPPPQASPA